MARMLKEGLIRQLFPDRPGNRLQKYRLTGRDTAPTSQKTENGCRSQAAHPQQEHRSGLG